MVRYRDGMLHMKFKLGQSPEKPWRKLCGSAHHADVILGADFVKGLRSSNHDQAAT